MIHLRRDASILGCADSPWWPNPQAATGFFCLPPRSRLPLLPRSICSTRPRPPLSREARRRLIATTPDRRLPPSPLIARPDRPRSISLPRSSREGHALLPISGSSSASDRESRLSHHPFWSSLHHWCWKWSSPAWTWSPLLALATSLVLEVVFAREDLVSAARPRGLGLRFC